jgi:hypothetical protein
VAERVADDDRVVVVVAIALLGVIPAGVDELVIVSARRRWRAPPAIRDLQSKNSCFTLGIAPLLVPPLISGFELGKELLVQPAADCHRFTPLHAAAVLAAAQ